MFELTLLMTHLSLMSFWAFLERQETRAFAASKKHFQ